MCLMEPEEEVEEERMTSMEYLEEALLSVLSVSSLSLSEGLNGAEDPVSDCLTSSQGGISGWKLM